MEKFPTALELIAALKPDIPVFGLRPHAAGRAARWFIANFPGEVAYAYKANSSVFHIGALYGAGIRHFDVASLPELEDAATIPDVRLHFMHPIKSRNTIRRAYHEFGVRCFSLDTEDELDKIVTETGGAKDLELFVRIAVPAKNSRIPLERKFGIAGAKAAKLLVKTRQSCDELGLTFHVGSQTVTPDAYTTALAELGKLIVKAGVVVDAIDVGGGFPSRYSNEAPAPMMAFMAAAAVMSFFIGAPTLFGAWLHPGTFVLCGRRKHEGARLKPGTASSHTVATSPATPSAYIVNIGSSSRIACW